MVMAAHRLAFEDFHSGEAGPDAQRRASQRQTGQSQQRDRHTFFVSGNSLVVGVGRSDQVQCDGEKTEGLSFRDGPQDQTRNLEIPGSHFVRPGMTTQLGR
jgi:hypothetical protein